MALGLGIVGAFLPLLPSTCFMLLASWAFSKSSPAFHHWLYYKSSFSKSIQDWQQHRVIALKIKWIATASIIASYSITFIFVNNVYIVSSLGIGISVLLIYLYTKPSQQNNLQPVIYPQSPELHQQVN